MHSFSFENALCSLLLQEPCMSVPSQEAPQALSYLLNPPATLTATPVPPPENSLHRITCLCDSITLLSQHSARLQTPGKQAEPDIAHYCVSPSPSRVKHAAWHIVLSPLLSLSLSLNVYLSPSKIIDVLRIA